MNDDESALNRFILKLDQYSIDCKIGEENKLTSNEFNVSPRLNF